VNEGLNGKLPGRWIIGGGIRSIYINQGLGVGDDATNGGGMPDWASDANTGVNAFMVGNGAKTGLLDYAVRTNYKSARTANQFNKLRPTQQVWRTTNWSCYICLDTRLSYN
jgi:hypothetical protein